MGITGMVRIMALKNRINEANTIKRLDKLLETGSINHITYSEIEQAFNYLMLMRFRIQIDALGNNIKPDNYVNPGKLTEIEISIIKKIFSEINHLISLLPQQ